MRISLKMVVFGLIVIIIFGSLRVVPLSGSFVSSTFNGHEYRLYENSRKWFEAKAECEGRGGHLVTISSQVENDFIRNLIGSNEIWIGFTDELSEGNWSWITGEVVNYTNWASGEPNNSGNGENYGHMFSDGSWNDAGDPNSPDEVHAYVCEWENTSNLAYFQGHEYKLINISKIWTDAKFDCENRGGYLVTINSKEENLFIRNLVGPYVIWIGLTDEFIEGKWEWVTGEPITYTNWTNGEPNDAGGEDYAEMYIDGSWNDIGAPGNPNVSYFYVCEWGTEGFMLEINHPQYSLHQNDIWIDFSVYSHWEQSKTVNISFTVTLPNGSINLLHSELFITIWPDSTWYAPSVSYFVNSGNGIYIFNLSVTDNADDIWQKQTQLIVGPYFDLWINNDRYAYFNHEKRIEYSVNSFFSLQRNVIVTSYIIMPNGENLTVFTEELWLESYGWWNRKENFTFTTGGDYLIYFSVFDSLASKTYKTKSLCFVGPHFDMEAYIPDMIMNGEKEVFIGEQRKITFSIMSYFDFNADLNYTLKLSTPNEGVVIFDEAYFFLASFSSYKWELWYTFTSVGHYDAYFNVRDDTGNEWWSDNFCIEVVEGIKIWMEFDSPVQIGTSVQMKFNIENHIPGSSNLNVNIFLVKESLLFNNEETLFKDTIFLEFLGLWEMTLSHTFTSQGQYKIVVIVTEYTTNEWSKERWVDVTMETQTTSLTPADTTTDDTTPEINITSGFEIITLMGIITLGTLYKRRIKK